MVYILYYENKQQWKIVVTNNKVTGEDEGALDSKRSSIEAEDSSTPRQTTVV